jgi:ATP-dependent protease ClpP protease subunit
MSHQMPKIFVTDFSREACLENVEILNAIVQHFGPEQPIVVHIESYGGSTVGFFILHDALRALQNPIITYTTGIAASAGLFLFMSAAPKGNRIVGQNAELMFHGVQTTIPGGDLKDVREDIKLAELVNDRLFDLTIKAMGLNSIEDLHKVMKSKTDSHNVNITPEEAIELGIADQIGIIKMDFRMGVDVSVIGKDDNKIHEECGCGDCHTEEVKEPKYKKKKSKKK